MTGAAPTFLSHPRGLATLFLTEMFERFSYYGMRALLILFMTATALKGGLGIDATRAGAIYGLVTGGTYLFCLAGGWVADRLIGQQRAVLAGGCLISAGNFLLAVPGPAPFYFGLLVTVLGVGLLKPNVSAIVGALYEGASGTRRDAGFSIFYMGINLGAFIAPFVAGTVGEILGYRWGFFCSGLAMLIGVAQFQMTKHYLGHAGLAPAPGEAAERARAWRYLWIALAAILAIALLINFGVIAPSVVSVAQVAGYVMVAIGALFFGSVLIAGGLTEVERRRVYVIIVFVLCAALFWAGFEQAGSSLNLFARDYTDRSLFGGWFASHEHPTSWYQSVNPVYIIVLSPVFAWIWVALGRRNLDPSAPAKFGLGLIQVGIGFAVMMLAAELVGASGKVAPTWLVMTYLLHTMGELCFSPIGLSNVTKLAPARYSGQMMGTWFLGTAIGNLAAGLIGGHLGASTAAEMPHEFLIMTVAAIAGGVLMLAASRTLRRWMGGIT
jgi:proton-dependent oligopeptide transporter, POT family